MFVSLFIFAIILNKIQANCIQNTFVTTEVKLCFDRYKFDCFHKEISGCASPDVIPANVTYLSAQSNVAFLKRNAIQNLPKLHHVRINSVGLKAIYPNCFLNLPKVNIFDGARNKIKSISYGIFTNTTFGTVHLSYNQISDIEEEAFGYMPDLLAVYIHSNHLESIEKYWFVGSPKIAELDFKDNRITTIKSDVFEGLRHLNKLDLSFNQIQKIENFVFQGLKFNTLNLMHSNISELTPAQFGYEVNVERLYVGMNKITHLSNTFLDSVKKISSLQIFPNPISCPCFDNLRRWATLNNVTIIKPHDDIFLHWENGQYPTCIIPVDRRFGQFFCDYNSTVNDKEGIISYFNRVWYDEIASKYAKEVQI